MKQKSVSRLVRRSFSEGGCALARRSLSTRRSITRRLFGKGGFCDRRALFVVLLCGVACSIAIPTMSGLAFFRPESPMRISHPAAAGLTFAERVVYQRAIEEVYWRHRIWPKERPDTKPALDTVMSHAQLENKVADYMRESQDLEDYWQRPITHEQLQAEMDRMAKHTKQPEVLRELFQALGSDPFVVAECLARPALSNSLVRDLDAHDQRLYGQLKRDAQSVETKTRNVMAATRASYSLPTISDAANCSDDTWTATSTTNNPTARAGHTAVWTGSEMIVWGGYNGVKYWSTGGKYNPSTDSWTTTSTTNVPDARASHTSVWTGSEMIVWGGYDGSSFLNTGGRYNPGADTWTPTSTTNAPGGRQECTAVWTGSEMIVWGGYNGSSYLNTGRRYNPSIDSWTATSTTNPPQGRYEHTAVWTGSEMIVWGGFFGGIALNNGGKYNPGTDSWTATSTTSAPSARGFPTSVWTGAEMIIWGGWDDLFFLNTGGRYKPNADTWTATSTTNAPADRFQHTAVWAGSEMIVWGGWDPPNIFNTGGKYNPGTNSWTATSTTNAPTARYVPSAVWTGSEMIVWGGFNGSYLNTGGRYCARSASPTPTPRLNPSPRGRPTQAPRP